ncbi:M23 family metallopeptidase [Streptomyces sp. NPDC018833]|uniref:M23 family metallopeptidase n=1 Tax=Streptomyces sp. NPDC018833 TaxID=3365053 RepID=UPI003793440A
MNDQHAHAGYGGYATGSFDSDPLFGAMPGNYESGHSGQYDASQWDTGSQQTTGYDAYASAQQAQQPQYDQQYAQYDTTGQWDASGWNQSDQTGQYETAAATFAYDATGQWSSSSFDTGAYDATAWNSDTAAMPEGLVPQQFTPQHEFVPAAGYDTGYAGYQSTELPGAEHPGQDFQRSDFQDSDYGTDFPAGDGQALDIPAQDFPGPAHPDYTDGSDAGAAPEHGAYEAEADGEYGQVHEYGHNGDFGHDVAYGNDQDSDDESEHDALTQTMTSVPVTPVAPRPVRRAGGSRGRRRTPAKRSALLTVAVPSACVMGVAGIAAASVGSLGDEQKDQPNAAAADAVSAEHVAANKKMDTQLAALSADARDFGDRASRTQERIDLKARQEAERKKREEEAARREALRPKFVLPVKRDGLSAYYGQSGVNWMSLHTGIDFPVQYGTEVMAATDGTVRTQWNSAYGNMAIVTAADGTETWYCHLSTTRIRSGSVKAGDVIAYSGNSGNSTGPHLHFEVRPGGGSAIDPLPWLRGHGLDPT